MGFSTSVIPVNLTGRYKVSIFQAVMALTKKMTGQRGEEEARKSVKKQSPSLPAVCLR